MIVMMTEFDTNKDEKISWKEFSDPLKRIKGNIFSPFIILNQLYIR